MAKEKFVVVDFVVRRTGTLPKKDGKTVKVSSRELAERAVARVKTILTKTLDNKRGRVGYEFVGATGEEGNRSRQGHPYLASIIVKRATINDVMRMEDILRPKANEENDVVIPLKMRDSKTQKYLTMEASEFRLNGPKGGKWEPFTGWYKGAKALGLPI